MLYDSKDLVTHALCVGMTGSGKTGLGIAAIEEAAIDGVPVIVIDPKGDLTNLLLTFPNLRPDDFAPWVNEDEARRRENAGRVRRHPGGPLEERAGGMGRRRRAHQAPARCCGVLACTRRAVPRVPGVDPVVARAPGQRRFASHRERVRRVSSVLALIGVSAEPFKSREHILLSTILLSRVASW